jgi:hypothetical protein
MLIEICHLVDEMFPFYLFYMIYMYAEVLKMCDCSEKRFVSSYHGKFLYERRTCVLTVVIFIVQHISIFNDVTG